MAVPRHRSKPQKPCKKSFPVRSSTKRDVSRKAECLRNTVPGFPLGLLPGDRVPKAMQGGCVKIPCARNCASRGSGAAVCFCTSAVFRQWVSLKKLTHYQYQRLAIRSRIEGLEADVTRTSSGNGGTSCSERPLPDRARASPPEIAGTADSKLPPAHVGRSGDK